MNTVLAVTLVVFQILIIMDVLRVESLASIAMLICLVGVLILMAMKR